MKISTTTEPLFPTFSYEEGIDVCAEAGFEALDLNMFGNLHQPEWAPDKCEKLCAMMRDRAERHGLYFNQAHAPFWPKPYSGDGPVFNAEQTEQLHRAIHCAGVVGAEAIIVHPVACADKASQLQVNLDFYRSLLPVARESGVKIALENMFGWNAAEDHAVPNVCSFGSDLGAYYDALNDPQFRVCLDMGHSGLVGETCEDAILALGSRLTALHVHDNNNHRDLHTMPYYGKLNWDKIMSALAQVGYPGELTFEVLGFFKDKKGDLDQMRKAFRLMAETGEKLRSMFLAAKN